VAASPSPGADVAGRRSATRRKCRTVAVLVEVRHQRVELHLAQIEIHLLD
jgi:hypothetical protein